MTTRILCPTTSYPPAIGGAQLHTHQLFRRLSPEFQVRVLTLWAENRTDWLLGTTLHAPVEPQPYTIDGVEVGRLTLSPTERRRLRPYVWGYYLWQSLAIRRIAQPFAAQLAPHAAAADVIHYPRIGREPLALAAWQTARQRDIPFVLTPYHHPRWVGWRYRHYLQLYRAADALIALTETERRTLIDLGAAPQRVFVTGNGPHLAENAHPGRFRQAYAIPPDAPLILFLGQKYPYKGIDPLLNAAPLVWQKYPSARFAFIGPRTPYSRKRFAAVTDARLIELDTVDLQTKTDALATCTLLCLPSTQESFGGVFTEAWSLGKPVIGADIPASREVIDEGVNGYVVSAIPGPLAERITHLLAHPALAAQLGQAGQEKTARHYSWDRLAQKTEAVYTTVLSGN